LTTESQSGFVYTFKNQSDEDHIIRWEDYITDELIHIKEKEVRETVDFKLDQNGQKYHHFYFLFFVKINRISLKMLLYFK
jgi:hypothetical protein